jgi:valyl-tRNA synthetase
LRPYSPGGTLIAFAASLIFDQRLEAYFMGKHLEEFELGETPSIESLRTSDKWILSRLNSTIKYSTEMLDKYEFGKALNAIRDFFW